MRKKFVLLAILICLFSFTRAMAQVPSELSGRIYWQDGSPARGVTVTIGGYSTITNSDGFYRFELPRPEEYVVSISPPGKVTRPFRVRVTGTSQKDFTINW
jgi:Carboxypeptidase regulatory-like domain